jgi:hypothetical protein
MSAAVIDHLSRVNDAPVAYIYFNYRSRTEQTLYTLLSSLLRRLVQICSTTPQCISNAFEKHSRHRRLTLQECSVLIVKICKDLPVVYLVIYAVDESQDVSRKLFKTIRAIQKQIRLQVMNTTRTIPAIEEMTIEELRACAKLEVRASDQDTRQYILSRQPGFRNFLKNNPTLCATASDKVVEASGGM